jgi:hypothetical protein
MNVLPAPIARRGYPGWRAIASMMACGTPGANRVDGRIVDGDQRILAVVCSQSRPDMVRLVRQKGTRFTASAGSGSDLGLTPPSKLWLKSSVLI